MAWVSQTFGVASVSVAVKMSVIVPVSFGIIYYQESLNLIKVIGIGLALLAVFMATYKPNKMKGRTSLMFLPAILFIGSGFLDAFLKYNEEELVPAAEQALFASSIFGVAALFGLLFVIYRRFTNKVAFQLKAIGAGIALGVPNYGSIYFLLRALDSESFESSSLFALNNVGIVAVSTLLGVAVFKESLNGFNWWGLALALLSILLITYWGG
jgi:multidrug transporter EmrE-like cation transporter